MLGLARHSPPSWYIDRLHEELEECRLAATPIEKLSETSDVFFATIRARYDGFPVPEDRLPVLTLTRSILVYAYMLAKFTLRWGFYRTAGLLCHNPRQVSVREVVNPGKDHKLEEAALRNQLDPSEFRRVGCRLRRWWPLLP